MPDLRSAARRSGLGIGAAACAVGCLLSLITLISLVYAPGALAGAGPAPPSQALQGDALKRAVGESIDRGLDFLRSKQDRSSGAWRMQDRPDPGITALAVTAFLRSPRKLAAAADTCVAKPLDYLASLAKADGSISDQQLSNYVTAAAAMALRESGEPRFQPLLAKAQKYLVLLQSDEGEGHDKNDRSYGGAGYGTDDQPDMSNMNFWMEGVAAIGLPRSDEAFRKALVFLGRCQNHSETNDAEWKDPTTGETFVSGNDGGGIYMPGGSPAGALTLPDGRKVARSYGSMTYALLKCYLLAGLSKEDPRVKAAVDWIGRHFTVDENPGFDSPRDPEASFQGLYYYYMTMSRALHEYGEPVLKDGSGRDRRWAEELSRKILSLQKEDGSWIGKKSRWWENVPELATSYALLALEHSLPHL